MQTTASSGQSEKKPTRTRRKPKEESATPSAATNGRRRRKQPEEAASVPSAKASKQSYEGQEATKLEVAQAGDVTSEEEAAPAASTEESSKSSQEQETGGQEGNGIPVMEDYLTESKSSLRQPLQCHALPERNAGSCRQTIYMEPCNGSAALSGGAQWTTQVRETDMWSGLQMSTGRPS